MASRSKKDCHPVLLTKLLAFEQACEDAGIDILVYCTYRSNEEQNALYAQGRTKAGKIVTYARGGQSKHNHTVGGVPSSLAFDCVPLRGGRPVWGRTNAEDLALWVKVGKIGKSCGLEWAGDWKKFKEFPHFQTEIPS